MLTKKHFIAFAAEIKKQVDYANSSDFPAGDIGRYKIMVGARFACDMVCKVQDNSNFDEARFRKACGL